MKKKTSKDSILRQLQDEVFVKKLYVYSYRFSKRFNGNNFSPYIDHEEIVHEAIIKTLEGVRPWNEEEDDHDLFSHFAGCIKSIINHKRNKKEFLTRTHVENFDDYEDKNDFNNAELVIEIGDEIDRWVAIVEKHAPDLLDTITEIIKEELMGRQEISDYFNIPIKDADNLIARLKRVYRKYKKTG